METSLRFVRGGLTFEHTLKDEPPVGDFKSEMTFIGWVYGVSRHGLKFTTRTLGADMEQRIPHRVACTWTILELLPYIGYPGVFLKEVRYS